MYLSTQGYWTLALCALATPVKRATTVFASIVFCRCCCILALAAFLLHRIKRLFWRELLGSFGLFALAPCNKNKNFFMEEDVVAEPTAKKRRTTTDTEEACLWLCPTSVDLQVHRLIRGRLLWERLTHACCMSEVVIDSTSSMV